MLSHLHIANYAIIKELNINFNEGLTVITGETGAGKSVLLGALSLILGKRVDTSVLNDNSKKCVVEGSFQVKELNYLNFFDSNNLDFENETIVRREISPTGKSRAFINDTPVTLLVLKEFANLFVDIHSQHQTLQVKDNNFQVDVVDAFVGLHKEVKQYQEEYKEYLSLKKEYENTIRLENTAKSDLDYITFQLKEIENLSLKENEQEHLEEQLELINNAEEINNSIQFAVEAFNNGDYSLLSTLKSVKNSFNKISSCSEELKDIEDRINSSLIELEDVSRDIELLNNTNDFDIENADYINQRLNLIYTLEQKHKLSNSNELLVLQKNLQNKISEITSFDSRVEELAEEVNIKEAKLKTKSSAISKKRIKSFPKLSKEIKSNLFHLGMEDASFSIKHSYSNKLTDKGVDEIIFMFSANKGFDLKELNKTASGGELSRLMLTIKSILNKNKTIPTILFDEIDTGVSGDIADKMGEIMKVMSKNSQVITITHLPQVAAKGDNHYKIFKKSEGVKTVTSVVKLSREDRVDELAKMLSGKDLTEAARENAKNLIAN